MSSHRHLARVVMSFDLLGHFLMTGLSDTWWRVSNGLPRSARLFNCWFDKERRLLVLVFEHESFPEVFEGLMVAKTISIEMESRRDEPLETLI